MLGVPSRSSNDAIRGELGMYPLKVYIYKQIVKFYFHLIDISKQSPIVRESLKKCENLVNNGKPSWIATVFNLLSLADIKNVNLRLSEEINRSSTLKQIEITIKSIYEKRFFERIHKSKRLSFVSALYISNYNEENYLPAITYHKYRSAITRLRISAHFLPIEKGRYESTPREKRVCPLCFSRSIGDAQHYLMHCTSPGFMKLRIDYFNKIRELKLLNMNKPIVS